MTFSPPRCAAIGAPCQLLQLESTGVRPVWAALDAARARHFTGALCLRLEGDDDELIVHLISGHVYLAERTSDMPIETRLVQLDVVSEGELAAGRIEFGDVSDFGRLFQRVPTIDRARVELAVEMLTGELLGSVADHPSTTVMVAHYRYHPSGLHRWYRTEPLAREIALALEAALAADADDAADEALEDAMRSRAPARRSDRHPSMRAARSNTGSIVPAEPPSQLTRVIEQVAAELGGHAPAGEMVAVSDDLRSAVRRALQAIEAASRPPITDGLSVRSLEDAPPAAFEGPPSGSPFPPPAPMRGGLRRIVDDAEPD